MIRRIVLSTLALAASLASVIAAYAVADSGGAVGATVACTTHAHRQRCHTSTTSSSTTSSSSSSTTTTSTSSTTTTSTTTSSASGLHVVGSHLENANGTVVRLHGVNNSADAQCMKAGSTTIFDGSINPDQVNVHNMIANHVNAVRITLDEDCWLGINGVTVGGAAYQTQVENWVNLITGSGLYAIVDLHGSAPGATLSNTQNNMADEDHSPAFWQGVATAFKNNPNVIFDLYNEPHDISWPCWLNGCTLGSWQNGAPNSVVAGMQQLVNTVRGTGASNVLLAGCLGWSNDCSDGGGSWLQYRPTDPDGNLAADFHVYISNGCQNTTCFTQTLAPIIQAGYPLVMDEWGDYTPSGTNNSTAFATTVLDWMDQNGSAGYLTWTWNAWGYSSSDEQPLIAISDGSSLTPWGSYISGQYAQRFP